MGFWILHYGVGIGAGDVPTGPAPDHKTIWYYYANTRAIQ